jgi:acyl-CoA synthetase (AMP-forming)/AMP-acid ligase II
MGLIGSWLAALYFGMPIVILSPLAFLAQPARWLWALHAHRGTLSAAPNFAFELCVRKITEEEIRGLDLSAWRLAFNYSLRGEHMASKHKYKGEVPLHEHYGGEAKYAVEAEALLPTTKHSSIIRTPAYM